MTQTAETSVYQVTYTLTTAGTYTMHVTVKPDGLDPAYEIIDFPQQVTCQITTAHAPNTEIRGEGINDAMAGVIQTFTVTLYDIGGNRLQIGGDVIDVTIAGSSADIEIFDQLDGSYTVQYRILVANSYTLEVVTNMETASPQTSTITVIPNEPSTETSTISFLTPVTLDQSNQVSVILTDLYNNNIIDDQPIVLTVEGQGQTIFATFVALSAHSYQTDYTIPSGTEDSSYCGQYTISAFLMVQGGLESHYYSNRWFSGYPYLEKVDSQINFYWGTQELITDVASDFVSVIWEGFLTVPSTDDYIFSIHSNDGVTLYID